MDKKQDIALAKLSEIANIINEISISTKSIESIDQLARKVREKRRERNISQMVLAEMTGVHQKTISKLESGDQGLSLASVMAITKALGVEVCLK